MTSITMKAMGHNGNKDSFVTKGREAKNLDTNGACIDEVISTTWARNTKSGTFPFFPAFIVKPKLNFIY